MAGGPVSHGPVWDLAPRMFAKTKPQQQHNQSRPDAVVSGGAEAASLIAGHGHLKANGVVARGADMGRRQTTCEADNCGGLEERLPVAVGARLMLRRNLSTEDGLVYLRVIYMCLLWWVEHPLRHYTLLECIKQKTSFKGR